ncbi:MAG: (d)CMP kinase [Thermotaleaceae bacterium]
MCNVSIAIDGPAGAGKSTIAKIIAKIKNFTYIDTGAMYRAVTLKILEENVSLQDRKKIEHILMNTRIDFIDNDIYLNDIKVTQKIRSPQINQIVSDVAKIPIVRKRLVELQQKIAQQHSVVMDGRDIGTYVLPRATFKFFLTASIETRAKRRFDELKEKNYSISLAEVQSEIENRDSIDSGRELAPLTQAEDAILIDTTGMSIEEVVNELLSYIQ